MPILFSGEFEIDDAKKSFHSIHIYIYIICVYMHAHVFVDLLHV